MLRKPPTGGLLKPTFSTAVGVDAGNYVVVATYRISANVQADGSATGTGGSRLTADRFDQSVDRAAERIAAAQKLKAKGLVEPGKAGDMIARVYDYTRPGGSSARYAFAFRGHTEYSIACFWNPAHATALSAACDQVMASLQRQAVRVSVPDCQTCGDPGPLEPPSDPGASRERTGSQWVPGPVASRDATGPPDTAERSEDRRLAVDAPDAAQHVAHLAQRRVGVAALDQRGHDVAARPASSAGAPAWPRRLRRRGAP